jgi:hypothetical protein
MLWQQGLPICNSLALAFALRRPSRPEWGHGDDVQNGAGLQRPRSAVVVEPLGFLLRGLVPSQISSQSEVR